MGFPLPKGGGRYETPMRFFPALSMHRFPLPKGGGRIETGCGLLGPIRRMGFPLPKGGGRIETEFPVAACGQLDVSPFRKAGGGLKRFRRCAIAH